MKLIGGLGNQLFQYAAARSLAKLHRTTLKLDITAFEHYKLHKYSLNPFRIREEFASIEEIAKIKGSSASGLAKIALRMNRKFNPYYRESIFSETDLRPFDPRIVKTPKHVYLDGYWQSEKYFVDVQEIIRREFTVKCEPDPESRRIADKIAGTQSVNIHVRRGDYVSDARTNQVHGTCSLDYYKRCVNCIVGKVPSPHFFVFSDDPSWVAQNLRLEHPTTFVSHNDASKNYEDLQLMSMCKHHIIANSSFSWWGAWLCTSPGKVVFAPQQWLNRPEYETCDLIPAEWYRM